MNDKPEKASLFIVFLMLFLLSFFYLILGVTAAYAQPAEYKMTRNEYINTYKDDAIKEMLISGVPASITLAQGMLESDNGNSALAVYANNHFGIKCHSDWTGLTYIQDDDTKDECFRKYAHVLDSYADHSNFLKTRKRYAHLFEMRNADYKDWAYGLKNAGYATDPKYADKLIQLIEENDLAKYDEIKDKPLLPAQPMVNNNLSIRPNKNYEVHKNNKRKYISLKQGDTFYAIGNYFKIEAIDLYRYNDCDEKYIPKAGTKIYLEPKRKKAEAEKHIVKKGDTMHSISQEYGVKLKSLYRINKMKRGTEPAFGDTVLLK